MSNNITAVFWLGMATFAKCGNDHAVQWSCQRT